MKSMLLNENPHYCTLCNLDLSSEVMALTHYQGENHAENLRKHSAGTLPNVGGFGTGVGFRAQNNTGSKRKSDSEADNSKVKIVKVESGSGQNERTLVLIIHNSRFSFGRIRLPLSSMRGRMYQQSRAGGSR